MKTILGGLWVIVNYWSKQEAGMNSEAAFANDFDIYEISDSAKKNSTYNLVATGVSPVWEHNHMDTENNF